MAATARRILVYGVTGSGKSTAAQLISQVTGLPYHSVDDLTWEPNWVMVPPDEQRRRIAEICAREEWVLDSAYGKWRDIPLARADVIVALDYPRWLSLARLLRRTTARMIDKRPICNGNRETLRTALSRDSIIVWHFKSFKIKRRRMRDWTADPPTPSVRRFERPRELAAWIRTLRPVTRSPHDEPPGA